MARPSRIDLQGKAIALPDTSLLHVYEDPLLSDYLGLDLSCNDSFLEDTGAYFASDTSSDATQGTRDLVSRPSEEELRDKSLIVGDLGDVDEQSDSGEELPDLGSTFSDLSGDLNFTHNVAKGWMPTVAELFVTKAASHNQSMGHKSSFLWLSASVVFSTENLLLIFLEVLFLLVRISSHIPNFLHA